MVCRLGSLELLQVMLDAGCDVQISDDYGRTPLHDACWAAEPALDVVQLLLDQDPRLLFMVDARGAVPLSYVQNQHFSIWIEFLSSHKEVFWPHRPSRDRQDPPPLTLLAPHSRPVRDPDNALSLDLARMVASGRLSPEEVAMLQEDDDEEDDDDDEEDDDDEDFERQAMRSISSDFSFSGRVSFGGNTFNFSDSESSESDSDDYDDDDDDEDEEDDEHTEAAEEQRPVETIITEMTIPHGTVETVSTGENVDHDAPPKHENKAQATSVQPPTEFGSPVKKSAEISVPAMYQSPQAFSPVKCLSSAEKCAVLITPGKSPRKKKKRRPRDGRSRASSRGSDSASIHSDASFQTNTSRSVSRNVSSSTYPSTESGYQDSLRSRRQSLNTLSSTHSDAFLSKKDLFCLMEDDDGLLAGSC
jgi:Ankyrin repeats (many copies)